MSKPFTAVEGAILLMIGIAIGGIIATSVAKYKIENIIVKYETMCPTY